MPTRPKSIVQFERIYAAIIALGLLSTALGWSDMVASVEMQRMVAQLGSAWLYASAAIGVALQLLLWFFIARRGSVVAKWIFVVLTAAILIWSLLALPAFEATAMGIIGLVLIALQAYAIYLLFRPDTRGWFGEEAPAA